METNGPTPSNEPVDRDTAAFLQALVERNAPPLTAGTPADARANAVEFRRRRGIDPVEIAVVEDIDIPTAEGPIAARRYSHVERASAVLVFFHGGGWVLGDLDGHDALCRLLARDAEIEVLNVDYRLAPEHPFPAAFEDAFAATCWAAQHLTAGRRPLIVAGDSSGGNLAATVALRARDEGSPEIALQILLYPILDHDLNTDSYKRMGEGFLLRRDDMAWFFDHYVPDASRRADPYVSPLRAPDLRSVAPAYIAVGGYDPLLDEAVAYARRLRDAGVQVVFKCYASLIHGFMSMPKAIPSTAKVIAEVIGDVRTLVADLSLPGSRDPVHLTQAGERR
jgi:acetyl esterase